MAQAALASLAANASLLAPDEPLPLAALALAPPLDTFSPPLGHALVAAATLALALLSRSSLARLRKRAAAWSLATAAWPAAPPALRAVPPVAGYPLLGILPQMCADGLYSSVMRALFDAARDAGLSRAAAAGVPVVFVRDPALIRQVLVHNADAVTRLAPDGSGPFGIMQRITGTIAASAEGPAWHRWRRGLLRDFSSPAALRRSYDDVARLARKHVARLRAAGGGAGPDLAEALKAYALDTVWAVTAGDDDVAAAAGDDIGAAMAAYGAIVGSPSHMWRHHVRNLVRGRPYSEPDAVERAVGERLEGALRRLLDRNMANLAPNALFADGRKPNLLRATSEESGGTAEQPVTPDVLAQARQVFSLGHEAPTLLLVWAVVELSRQPDVVRCLRREMAPARGPDGRLDFDALRALPYLDQVATELLRVHPPISSTARLVTRPIAVTTRTGAAAVIPAGAHLFASVHLLHHDPQVWGPDADAFVPERWADVRANAAESRCEYMPFLAGPRGCPSAAFVMVQLKTMIAELLAQVDIELPGAGGLAKCVDAVVTPSQPVAYTLHEVCS